jgi:ADP-ribose pyrophosphatase
MPGPTGSPPGGWKRLRETLLLDRPPWLRVYADDVELADGRRVDGFLRIEARPYATVFAVTPDGLALFLHQYKYGPDCVALQLPAGYLEAGEDPAAAARRELLEETGYEAHRLEPLGAFRPDGNRGFGFGHFFLARDARFRQAPDSDDLEVPAIELVPLADCEARMTSGEMVELAPIACVALALARLKLG